MVILLQAPDAASHWGGRPDEASRRIAYRSAEQRLKDGLAGHSSPDAIKFS
jgi:hypothetical protein